MLFPSDHGFSVTPPRLEVRANDTFPQTSAPLTGGATASRHKPWQPI